MQNSDDQTRWTFVEFGTQLRRRRRSADLTQRALARAANCSEHTVKKLEQGLRRPSKSMATSLAEALGLSSDEHAAFVRAGTGDSDAESNAYDEHADASVPVVNPLATVLGADTMTVHCWDTLVGRSRDLVDIPALLQRSRLVTLHGPGGVGKSRLAAELVRRDDSGPTLWVEFKHLEPGDSVDGPIARSLQVGQSASTPLRHRVIARLGTDNWLVVLDNCEGHITDLAEWCSAVLDACPSVRILVTSRELTYLAGETRWPVRGLSTRAATGPNRGPYPSDAFALFVERASAADPSVLHLVDGSDPDAIAAIAAICDHLDGLPLAIELAAARTDLYPPATLAARVEDDRRFLELRSARDEPRYTNLDDMVAWSYELLAEDERRCVRALCVFRGSFDIEAAHAVCGVDVPLHEFEQSFARLVGSSLVSRTRDGTSTFHVLETIRAAVVTKQSHSEVDEIARRHAAYFAERAELAQPQLWSSSVATALAALARHHADYSAAVTYCCDRGDAATARRLTGALFRYWDVHGHLLEGLSLCRRAEATEGVSTPEIDARAANALGTLSLFAGDVTTAVPAFERAAELSQAFGIGHELAYALVHLGLAAAFADESATATRVLGEAAAVARHHGEQAMEGWAHVIIGADDLRHERYDAAEAPLDRGLVLLTDVDAEGVAWALVGQAARVLLSDNEPHVAEVGTALQACIDLHSGWGISVSALLGGICAARVGRPDLATGLLTASDQLCSLIGAAHLPMMYEWRALLIGSIGDRFVDAVCGDGEPHLDPLDVINTIDDLFDQLSDGASLRR